MAGSPRSCWPRSESPQERGDPTARAGGSTQRDTDGELTTEHLEKIGGNKTNQSRAPDTAPLRNFIPGVSVRPSVPLLSIYNRFFLYSPNPIQAEAAPGVRMVARVPRRRSPLSGLCAPRLRRRSPRRIRYPARGRGAAPESAQHRRLAPRPRGSPGRRRSRNQRGPRGAAFRPRTELGGELYLTLGKRGDSAVAEK